MLNYTFQKDGNWYMGSEHESFALPATQEQVRMLLGEAAMNAARNFKEGVVTVEINRIKCNVDELLRTKQ